MHRKVAWDLAFLYIEWKYKDLQELLVNSEKEYMQKIKQDI